MANESKTRRRRFAPALAVAIGAMLATVASPAAAHNGEHIYQASGTVYTVAWNPQGTILAAATAAGNITLIDGVAHVAIKTWHAADGPINEVSFSPDGGKLAVATGAYRVKTAEQSLKVWDIIGPTLLLNISGHYDWVTSVSWSPDGRYIASASGVDDHTNETEIFGQVMFWEASTGALLWNASPLDSYPARIAWAPDTHALASVGHLNDIWVFYPDEVPRRMERINHTFQDPVGHASHGWAISWSPDSRYIVGGFSRDTDYDGATDVGPVIVFDPDHFGTDGYALQLWRGEIHSRPAEWVGWDSTGNYIASCSGTDLINATTQRPGQDGIVDAGELVIYNFSKSKNGRLAAENVFIFSRDWCSSLAFRPGNLTVAAGSADGTVKIYIFDEDGDGCMVWVDAAPQDPTVCDAPRAPVGAPFLDTWGLPIALALGAAGAIGAGLLLLRRGSAGPVPPSRAKRRKGQARGRLAERSRRRR